MDTPETPEERANNLLLQHLTPGQRKTWTEKGYFDFDGQGFWFRVYTTEKAAFHGGAFHTLLALGRIKEEEIYQAVLGTRWAKCFHSFYRDSTGTHELLPSADMALAIKLTLELEPSIHTEACTSYYERRGD